MEERETREEWNTGSGYFARINELLSFCDEYQIKGRLNDWYSCLMCLYKEIIPKLAGEHKKELIQAKDDLLKVKEGKEKIPSMALFDFEIKIREMLEHKNMLTPKGDDPAKALK